jgi:hypothetical protein
MANVAVGHNINVTNIVCNLQIGNSTFSTILLQSGSTTGATYQTIPLVVGGTLASSGTIRVQCSSSAGVQTQHVTVTAIQTTTWTTLGSI